MTNNELPEITRKDTELEPRSLFGTSPVKNAYWKEIHIENELVYPACKYCKKDHKMGIEDMQTGKITPLDTCEQCLFYGKVLVLTDEVNLSSKCEDELKKLENELIERMNNE